MADDNSSPEGADGIEPSEREGDEEFTSLRLDEAFIKAATRSEPAARHRAPTRPLPPRPARRPRFGRQTAWMRRHRGVVIVGTIVVALIGIAAAEHIGPFARGSRTPASPASSLGTPSLGSPRPTSKTSSTAVQLADRFYNRGDCVRWATAPTAQTVSTIVVPCSQPHLIEIVSEANIPASVSGYPDDEEWINLAKVLCARSVTSYLGYRLDPAGRFQIQSIDPTLDGWDQDVRTLWCGIGVGSSGGTISNLFTGVVRGQSQEFLYPIGTCLSAISPGGPTSSISCIQPHSLEVAGNGSLASLSQLPQGSSAFSEAVQSQCAVIAAQYVGGALSSKVQWGWLNLSQTNWDAGDRTVQCTVEAVDRSGSPTVSTGSLQG